MPRKRKYSMLRIAIIWRDTLVREATIDDVEAGFARGGPFYDLAIPGLGEGDAPLFRRDRRDGWRLLLAEGLSGMSCLAGQAQSLPPATDRENDARVGEIVLAPGDWGMLDQGPVSLFFQVQQPQRLPRRRLATLGSGRFAASVVVAAFLAMTLMVVSGLVWEPTVRSRSRAPVARPMRIATEVTPQKTPDLLKIREDNPDPLRHERLKFGRKEEPKPKQIVRQARVKEAKPLRPAHVVMIEGAGSNWAAEEGDSGGFDLPGEASGAFAIQAPKPPPPPPPAPRVDVAQLTREYLQKIREELGLRKVYPLAAQRMGAAGAVSLSFVVHPDGTFTDVRVKRSSGNDLLDRAALQTVASLSGKIHRPKQIGAHSLKTSVVLRYELG